MARHLSKNRKKFDFIAQHKYEKKDSDKKKKNQTYSKFVLCLEKGEPEFILPQLQQSNHNYVTLLLKAKAPKEGSAELLLWLECFVNAIIQLEIAGIYHEDLNFRNTIKIVVKNSNDRDEKEKLKQYLYKLIDFNYAFKVCYTVAEEESKCPYLDELKSNTEKIIELWL